MAFTYKGTTPYSYPISMGAIVGNTVVFLVQPAEEGTLGYTIGQSLVVSATTPPWKGYYFRGDVTNIGEKMGYTEVYLFITSAVNSFGTTANETIDSYWDVNISGSVTVKSSPGATGQDGTSGTSGIDGASGSSGTSGQDGLAIQGAPGQAGTSGTSGIDGTTGLNGSDGTSGTSGLSGSSGIDGTSGQDGTSGTSGIDGTSGTSGQNGLQGPQGVPGPLIPGGNPGDVLTKVGPNDGEVLWVSHPPREFLYAKTLYVDPNGSDENKGYDPTFPKKTIQSAIDGSSPGDIIKIYRGVYIEDITISKESITLMGESSNGIFIYPTITGNVLVNSTGVNITNVAISGNLTYPQTLPANQSGFALDSSYVGGTLYRGDSNYIKINNSDITLVDNTGSGAIYFAGDDTEIGYLKSLTPLNGDGVVISIATGGFGKVNIEGGFFSAKNATFLNNAVPSQVYLKDVIFGITNCNGMELSLYGNCITYDSYLEKEIGASPNQSRIAVQSNFNKISLIDPDKSSSTVFLVSWNQYTKRLEKVDLSSLPTTGVSGSGTLYNDNGFLKIS